MLRIAALRVLVFVAAMLLQSLAPNLALAQVSTPFEIEGAMRLARDRAELIGVNLELWPPCCGESGDGPANPPNKYYGSSMTAECAAVRVEALRVAVEDILEANHYLKDSALEYTDDEWNPPRYSTEDFPGITTSTSTSNYMDIFEVCRLALSKLHLVEMQYPGSFDDQAVWGVWLTGDGDLAYSSSEDENGSCEVAWTTARGYWYNYFEGQWAEAGEGFPSVGYGLSSRVDSEPTGWAIEGIGAEATRAKYLADFDGHSGTAYIFLRLQVLGDGLPPGDTPVTVDEMWHPWTSVSSSSPRTGYIGDQEIQPPPAECPANFNKGWTLFTPPPPPSNPQPDGVRVIFDIPPIDKADKGVCQDGQLPGPPNVPINEEIPLYPIHPPAGCGDPAGGGPPHEGDGPKAAPKKPRNPSKELPPATSSGETSGHAANASGWLNKMMVPGGGTTDFPVFIADGNKSESAVDLVVPTKHGSFRLQRAYTSNVLRGGAHIVGNQWTMGVLAFMHPVGGNLVVDGWPVDHAVAFFETAPNSGIWKPEGAGTEYFNQATVSVDGTATDTWTLQQPGAWKLHFYRGGDLDGLLLAEEDEYGNKHVYEYALFGSEPAYPRLVRIFLDRTDDKHFSGSIEFSWYLDGAAAYRGKLKSVQYYQLGADQIPRLQAQVDYTYSSEETPDHEGMSGDLLQVTRYTRLDKVQDSGHSLFHPSVTLYRYHDGNLPSSDPDERQMAKGAWHQIKSVFNSEQIEFAAEELVASGGQTWTADESVLQAATYIRGLGDSASLYSGSPRKVLDYAAKIVSYEDLEGGRVTTEYAQTTCGCAGSAHGARMTLSYLTNPDGITTKIVEATAESDGSYSDYKITYCDLTYVSSVPFLTTVAVVDAADSSKRWVLSADRDSYNITKVYFPSAMASYRPCDDPQGYLRQVRTDGGLVVQYSYDTDHGISSVGVSKGSEGAVTNQVVYTYLTGTRSYLLSKIERFRDESSTSANDVETTEFEYGFHDSTDKIASVRTISEAELESENGPSGSGNTYDSYELYDSQGYNRWSAGADRSLTYRDFDARNGRVVQVTRNAPRDGDSAIPVAALEGDDFGGLTVSSWGTSSSGGSLTSTYTYDGLGRLTSSTSPGGVKSYTVRERRTATEHDDQMYFYAEVRLPHQLSASGPFDGPASVVVSNAAGKTIESAEYTLTQAGYDPPGLSYELSSAAISRRTVQTDSSGLVESTRAYTSNNPTSLEYDQTSFAHDYLGRLITTTDPSGTITKNSSFDIFGRVLAVQVGTGSGNMQTIAEYFYDSSYTGTPAQGVGDGLLTHVVQHTGETGTGALSSAESRTTVRRYDWRNRLVITENPAAPHEVTEYDNLGRVTKRGLFSGAPDPEDLIDSSGRGLYSLTSYSQRGMVYRQETAIDASNLSSGYLATNRWFDADGRVIAEWGPNGPASKTVYDGLGRPSAAYVTDRAGDAAPGASSNYADAAALTGDHVAEQSEYRYDSKGRTDLITTRRRPHDSSATGAMDTSSGINTFVAYSYDAADRRTHTVSFGTNTSNDRFEVGGAAPTWPPTAALNYTNYPNTIITSVTFNERGLVDESVDGEGKKTKYFYDDLSRRIAVVENYVNATISWNGTAGRWEAGGLSSSEPDTDRVTSFVYDAAGNVTKQVAHLIEGTTEKAQVTAYDYGTTVGSVSTSTDSLVASNSLLLRVRYPKEDTGDAAGTGSGDASYHVTYSYNRLGELRSVTDQNTTRHVYFRDALGRVEADKADSIGSGVDTDIERIGVAYDSFGRTDAVTSYSDASGSTTANQVKFTYSPLWQIAKVYQDPNSAVGIDGSGNPTGDTKVVEYAYSTSAAPSSGTGHANYSRLASLTYPDGRAITYDYGTSNDVDDRLGRVAKMTTTNLSSSSSTDILVEYSRIGLDMFAEVDFPMPDVQLDRTLSHDGKRYTGSYQSQTAGVYPGFDRFGRVARQVWADGALTTHSTDNSISSRPPILEETHTYDRASNRKSKTDARKGASWSNRDFAYEYDGLHRLLTAKRGVSGTSFTRGPGWQDWSLDMLGNWNSVGTDMDGDGNATDPGETDTRTHNMANEMLTRSLTSTVPNPYNYAYDAAGNATEITTGYNAKRRYTHDAWNRLVKVENGTTSGGTTTWATVNQYQYNGLHWRIVVDADRSSPAGFDRRTSMYYSAGWQLLQEDIDDHTNNENPDGVNSRSQEVWGLRYIDDAMVRLLDKNLDGDCRDSGELFWQLSDAQFSTVAVIDKNAVLQERVSYTSYGVGTHRWPHEVNNTGGVTTSGTTSDYGVISGLASANGGAGTPINDSYGNYNVAADLNRDGVIDSGDTSLFTSMGGAKSALASGLISDANGPDNPFGYDGYVYNADQGLYTVRFRWYNATFGRWLERDPLGSRSNQNHYVYCSDEPTIANDSSGLLQDDTYQWPSSSYWLYHQRNCGSPRTPAWSRRPKPFPWQTDDLNKWYREHDSECIRAKEDMKRFSKQIQNLTYSLFATGCFGKGLQTAIPLMSRGEWGLAFCGWDVGLMGDVINYGIEASATSATCAAMSKFTGPIFGYLFELATCHEQWNKDARVGDFSGPNKAVGKAFMSLAGGCAIAGPWGLVFGVALAIGTDVADHQIEVSARRTAAAYDNAHRMQLCADLNFELIRRMAAWQDAHGAAREYCPPCNAMCTTPGSKE